MLGLVSAGKKVEFKWLSDNNFQLDVKAFINKINFEIKTGTASPFSSKSAGCTRKLHTLKIVASKTTSGVNHRSQDKQNTFAQRPKRAE